MALMLRDPRKSFYAKHKRFFLVLFLVCPLLLLMPLLLEDRAPAIESMMPEASHSSFELQPEKLRSTPQLEAESHPAAVAKSEVETAPKLTMDQDKCEWRPEPLQGICDVVSSTDESKKHKTAAECHAGCCEREDCISYQFRTKEGCMFGGDTRLGAEKDGPGAWCEPRAPATWHGQRLSEYGKIIDGACDDDGWKPDTLQGQCFGLGPKRKIGENTARACRDACCAENKKADKGGKEDLTCQTWQWRADAGCFYKTQGGTGNCKDADPLALEKFIGRRKVVSTRKYSPLAYSKDFADLASLLES